MEEQNIGILIIVPIYNEEENIEFVIKDLKENTKDLDILLIDDGSTDRSFDMIKSCKLNYIRNEINMGGNKTVQKGMKYAYENGYKYVIQFDADRQHKAKEISKLIYTLQETKANLIIGSRYIEKKNYYGKWYRKIGTKLSQMIIEKKLGRTITDATSGFRCSDRKVMKRIIDKGEEVGCLQLSFIIELIKERFEIEEVSVEMGQRIFGASEFKGIRKSLKYLKTTYKETKKALNSE